MTNDWFDDFLDTHTKIIITERIDVLYPRLPPKEPGGEPASFLDVELVNAVSWKKLFGILNANNIRATEQYLYSFVTATPKGRGRVAMNIGNSLRGAARRRGGLYSVNEEGKRIWCEAPLEWLRVQIEQDFTKPVEDREGNPL